MPGGNVLEYQITARDNATPVFQRAAKNAIQYQAGAAGRLSEATYRRIVQDQRVADRTAGGESRGAISEGLEGIHKQTRQLRRLIDLGGAVMIAERVGQSLEKIPEVAAQFRENLRNGMTSTQACATALADLLPGIGTLAKGFRSLGEFIMDPHGFKAEAQRLKDERTQRRDAIIKAAQDAEQRRQPIIEESVRGARESAYESRILGASEGVHRQEMEARVEHEKRLQEIADLREKGRNAKLTLDQQQSFNERLVTMQVAADEQLEERRHQIRKQAMELRDADEREHSERQKSLTESSEQDRLQLEGRFETARIAKSREATESEIRNLGQQYAERLKKVETGSHEEEAVTANFVQDVAAIRARGAEQEKAIAEESRREEARQERDHAQRILDERTNLDERRLRLAGRAREAERLVIDQAYQDRLAAIARERDAELEKDREHADQINARAASDQDAARQQHEQDLAEMAQRDAAQFRPSRAAIPSGESLFLTGVQNQGADPLLQPTETLVKYAQNAENHRKQIMDNIQKLTDYIISGDPGTPLRL